MTYRGSSVPEKKPRASCLFMGRMGNCWLVFVLRTVQGLLYNLQKSLLTTKNSSLWENGNFPHPRKVSSRMNRNEIHLDVVIIIFIKYAKCWWMTSQRYNFNINYSSSSIPTRSVGEGNTSWSAPVTDPGKTMKLLVLVLQMRNPRTFTKLNNW